MSGAKKLKLQISGIGKKKTVIGEMQRDANEWSRREKDGKKLRESVLNKLWDSLPPETQNLHHSDDEDFDSTQSGLDEGEVEDEEIVEESQNFLSPKDRASSECANKKMEESTISWDTNLDFIQSIIWLKSTTEKLQRVPADEFFKTFQNQWELSPKIVDSSSPTKTKQREKFDLIKNRLSTNDNFAQNQWDIVIPETDESESPGLRSSQCAPDRATTNITVSESIGNSTIDSGFSSEKPESAEALNSSEYMKRTENVASTSFKPSKNLGSLNCSVLGGKDWMKLVGARNRGSIFEGGPSTGKNDGIQSGKITTKRKHDLVFGTSSKTTNPKRPRLSISSATLNYVLRSSECNKVLLDSVRVILNALENEKNGCFSLGNNRYETVQQEAIEAVVTVVDQLEKEKGSNSCRNEVVAVIKRVLEKMLHSSEVDKLIAWEHHRLMIFELCNASTVCREVVNYLISELNKLIPVPMQTSEKNMRDSSMVMDKSYILFHSLKLALKKYRSFALTSVTVGEENVVKKIPEVKDLWKRHWKVKEQEPSDIFVTSLEGLEILEDPEDSWTRVLEKLVVVSTTIWPLVKILAWQCLAVLKSPVSSEARDR